MERDWHGKPYYSLDAYCKNTFGHKCCKIALNAHMTCPNRDGRLDVRGCIFCSSGGSGDFAVDAPDMNNININDQIEKGLSLFRGKKTGQHFIAYFQAYTNTYAPVEYLEKVYREALDCPRICGISIATRPDCLPEEVLSLLSSLQTSYPHKFLWIELGLQTIHEQTAAYIRRGYPLSCFSESFHRLKGLHIPVIVHVILGLPGENREMMLQTIDYLNGCSPFGVKLQLLHVLKDTDLFTCYENGEIEVLEQDTYLDLLTDCITHLSPDIVIHRVTGDGPKNLLAAPLWSGNKRAVLNSFHRKLGEEQAFQGKYYTTY